MLLVGFCRLTTMASPSQAARVSFAGMESGERVSLEAFPEGNTTASTSINTPTTFMVLLQNKKLKSTKGEGRNSRRDKNILPHLGYFGRFCVLHGSVRIKNC